MDIHLPKVPHSWRELAKEIAIIVVGVLIALFFESVLDSWRWHQKVASAKAAMRKELLWDDGPQIYQRAALHPCITASLDQIRAALDSGASRAEVAQLVDRFSLPFFSYDSVARDAANASDAWSHMPQDEAEPYILIYAVMPPMTETNTHEAYDWSRLRAFKRTGGPLTDAESSRLLEAVEALRQDEQSMWLGIGYTMPELRQLGPIDEDGKRHLMKAARNHYGACVKDLPPDFGSGPVPAY
jgi:hypothetical protein